MKFILCYIVLFIVLCTQSGNAVVWPVNGQETRVVI